MTLRRKLPMTPRPFCTAKRPMLLRVVVCFAFMIGTCPVNGQQAAPAKKQDRFWNSQWQFDSIDVAKIVQRLESIGIDVGVKLDGIVSAKFDVGVPLTSLRDGAAYRLDGTLISKDLRIDGVRFQDFQATIKYRDGVLNLTRLQSKVGPKDRADQTGNVTGTALMQLVPKGNLDANLRVERVSVAPIADLIAKFARPQNGADVDAGVVTGRVTLKSPIDSITDVSRYELDGQVTAEGLKLSSLPPTEIKVPQVSIRNGTLTANDFLLSASGEERIKMSGDIRLPLTGTGQFTIDVQGDDVPSHAWLNLFAPDNGASRSTTGKVDFLLNASGTIANQWKDSRWEVDGAIASPNLKLAGLDVGRLEHRLQVTANRIELTPRRQQGELPSTFKLQQLVCQYSIDETRLLLSEIDARMFDGRMTGQVALPTGDQGDVAVELKVAAVRPEFQARVAERIRPTVAATIDANVSWRWPHDAWDRPASHRGTANVQLSDVRLGSEPVGRLQVIAESSDKQLTLRANGRIFEGRIGIETQASLAANDRWSDVAHRFLHTRLQLDRLDLNSILGLTADERTRQISGTVSGVVKLDRLRAEQSQESTAAIRVTLNDLRYRNQLLSRTTELSGTFRDDVLTIDTFDGDYADGFGRIRGKLTLLSSASGLSVTPDLRISLSGNLDRAFWFLEEVSESLSGRASLTGSITGSGSTMRFRGNVNTRGMTVHGIKLGDVHSGLAADVNTTTLRWRLRLPTVQTITGGGRVIGNLKLSSGNYGGRGVNITSRWRTQAVDIFEIANQADAAGPLAHGRITGTMSLDGKSVTTVDDLVGEFAFKLDDTRGAAIPGLARVSQFLGPVSLATERFDVGEAKGSVRAGTVNLKELWLGSNSALVRADGKVYLKSQRMDIEALVATGNFADLAGGIEDLAREYALRSFLPASALLSVTELLRDRTIVVGIGGTIRSPIVRLKTVETFREEAVRFLLREGTRLISAGATAGALDLSN